MDIELVDAEDIKTGRGSGGKKGTGERYPKYRSAIQKTLPWLKEQIEEKGTIRIKVTTLAKELGPGFESKHPTSIGWALKYVLFGEGIWVDKGTTKSDEPVLVMRKATETDKLPDSLAKFDKDNGEEEVEEE